MGIAVRKGDRELQKIALADTAFSSVSFLRVRYASGLQRCEEH